jgi:NADH-quinone oxidoreductase subunit H
VNVFQAIGDRLAMWLFDVDPSTWPYMYLVYALVVTAGAGVTLGFVSLFAGPVSWIERRIAARIMSRIGPNRVGPQGVLQWLCDGLKCWMKEDLIPSSADHPLFRFAPYLVFGGMFGAFIVLPFGENIVAADMNVGVLFLLAVTGFVVIGMLMAGWGSNSKWAMFGGIRSAAQLVSYEIPVAFSLMTVVLMAGTMSLQGLIHAQGGMPWEWFVFRNPFFFVAFFLFFTASIAEGNRTPFDLPEAESELVAGYNVEYSGMRFLFFLFAEWANLWVMSAVATVAFLGGWQIPGVSPATIAAAEGLSAVGWQLLSFVVLAVKVIALVFLVIQLRWTVPRLRIDQLMVTCWKYLVPLSIVCILGVLVLMITIPEGGVVDILLRILMIAIGCAIAVVYVRKVRATYLATRDSYRNLEGKDQWYPLYRLP